MNKEIAKNVNNIPVTIDIEKDYLYKQGIAKKAREATINMLKRGFEVSIICEIQNVSVEYVLDIKKELNL